MIKRLVVTGVEGQVARCLSEAGASDETFMVVPLGRPYLDLSRIGDILPAIEAARPDIIVSAAAYTAVDNAETEQGLAMLINSTAAGELAKAAAALSVPIIHISSDYVFDGGKEGPYFETDPVGPLGVYGRSKLAGEQAVAAATDNFAILRTSWVYSPYGTNFVKTMLRIAATRDAVNVVNDQIGNPTSAQDFATGILAVARNLINEPGAALRGVFHMTGTGSATWAEFASQIFIDSRQLGGRFADVNPIPSSAYPTIAKRPANSRLDCTKLKVAHKITLPNWQESAMFVVSKLLTQ